MSNKEIAKTAKKNKLNIQKQLLIAFGGLSLKQIAERLNENPSSFWNWAVGRTDMPKETLAKIGKETGYSLNWILTGEGEPLTVEKKKFSDKELAEMVNQINWGLFTIEIFIYELAQINPSFKSMLTPESYARSNEIYTTLHELMDAEEEYGEYIRKEMYDDINSKKALVEKFIQSRQSQPSMQLLLSPKDSHEFLHHFNINTEKKTGDALVIVASDETESNSQSENKASALIPRNAKMVKSETPLSLNYNNNKKTKSGVKVEKLKKEIDKMKNEPDE